MKTLSKKRTHIAQIKQVDLISMQKCCELIGWSQEQYCNYQFEQYMAFLKRALYERSTEKQTIAMHSPILRGFWNNEWSIRNDTDFIPYAAECTKYSRSEVGEDGDLFLCWDDTPLTEFLIDEFQFTHNHYTLINTKSFMKRFEHALTLIKNA